ncbi:MAG: CinA family protein [Pseudomonadota bacterium]
MITQTTLDALAAEVGELADIRGWRIATAESCTGGWIAQALTAIPGSSAWVVGGFVTYANEAKSKWLGVQSTTLEHHGAVSVQVAEQMVAGLIKKVGCEVGVSVTGVAGPGGGSDEKPVGTVCFGFAVRGRQIDTCREFFVGDRREVRACAVQFALEGLLTRLK